MLNQALYSSKNMCWCTPQDLYDQLDDEFHFVLDAAATSKSAKCNMYYTPEDDGLSQTWNRGGSVFCNPPYGRNIKDWVSKAYYESIRNPEITIVLLIPARTDTQYFHEWIYGKANIRFIRGRLKFTDEDGNPAVDTTGRPCSAPFPSMIVIYNFKEEGLNESTTSYDR